MRDFAWFWLGGVKDPPKRLLVCTQDAIYVLRNSWSPPCSVCTSDQFCPDGPVLLHRIEYDAVLEIIRGFGGNMFRLTYENRGVYTTEDNLDFISDTCGVVDRLIEIIVSGVPTGQQVDVKTDQMTWLQLSKVINNGETKLDNIENMVMMYNAVQTRPISQNKKTGVISVNGDWEIRSVVLTASVPLEFQITPDGFTSDAQIELKQLLFFKEDYREWQVGILNIIK